MKLPLPAFGGGAEPFGRSDVLLIQSLSAREAAWRRLFDKSDNLSTWGQDAGRLVCAKLTHRRLPGHPRSCVDLLKFLRSPQCSPARSFSAPPAEWPSPNTRAEPARNARFAIPPIPGT